MVNASVKNGSGYAKIAGSLMFTVCALELFGRQLLKKTPLAI